MGDFKQAIEWLKEGKKVRRSDWGNKILHGELKHNFIHFSDDTGNLNSLFLNDVLNLEATDWEIYEEKVELKTFKDFYNVKYSETAKELEAEAIKWVKKDIKDYKENVQVPGNIEINFLFITYAAQST